MPDTNLQDIDFDGNPVDLVRIDPDDLEHELVMTPPLTASWNEKYADATMASLTAEAELDDITSELYIKRRTSLALDAELKYKTLDPKTRGTLKQPTAAEIDASVKSDPKYRELRNAHILAQVEQVRMKGRMEAVRRKAESLTAIGLKRNAEMRALSAVGMVR